MKLILTYFFILVSAFCLSQSLGVSQIDSLIVGIKKTINENYVLTDKAKLISDSLQSKNYYEIKTIDSLMNKLNNDFIQIANDKHLFIQYQPTIAEDLLNKKDIHEKQNKKEKREHYGFENSEILEGNIGYFKLNYFADATHAKKFVIKYFHHFNKTSALIIDTRSNLGGSGSMLQLLTGILLPGSENEILKINYKSGRAVTMKAKKIDSTKEYLKQPIYILCSNQTFSAGEAFALIMKNRSRAVIIGDTTAGAGNVAGPFAINNQFVLTVPVGIIVDPLTNKGWEHDGVIPDINVDSSQALDKALMHARINSHPQ